MDHVIEYRRRAKECRELAKAIAAENRAAIENIAEVWDKMADQRQKYLDSHPPPPDKPSE